MTFMCKKCRKAFRKDMSNYEESDEYCPHCDNHYVRALPVFPTFQPRDFGAVQRGSHWPQFRNCISQECIVISSPRDLSRAASV